MVQSWKDAFGETTLDTDVVIKPGQRVIVSSPVKCGEVWIQRGETPDGKPNPGVLEMDPNSSAHIIQNKVQFINEGILRSRPSSHKVIHEFSILGVDETRFVGSDKTTPHEHLDYETIKRKYPNDLGWWTVGHGKLDLQSSKKTPHVRLSKAIKAGDKFVPTEETPQGWQPGDEIVVTTFQPPVINGVENKDHWKRHSESRVASVSTGGVTMETGAQWDHHWLLGKQPPLGYEGRKEWGARLINLTRNVRFQGEPGKHPHFLVQAHHVVTIDAEFKHMGPDKRTEYWNNGRLVATDILPVLGRYACHFHHAGRPAEFPAQQHITPVSMHKIRGRALVVHMTDGLDASNSVFHNVQYECFWWDHMENSSHITFNNCVASYIPHSGWPLGYRHSAFKVGDGFRNVMNDCLATGVGGESNASGYIWDEGEKGNWEFRNNESFCNKHQGFFTWQNLSQRHVIDQFVAGWCGDAFAAVGAYINSFQVKRSWSIANRLMALRVFASSSTVQRQSFHLSVEGQGITKRALAIWPPRLVGEQVMLMNDWIVSGLTEGIIEDTEGSEKQPHFVRLDGWKITTNLPEKAWVKKGENRPHTVIQVRNWEVNGKVIENFDVVDKSHPEGVLVPEWNAKRVPAPANDDFYWRELKGKTILQDKFSETNGSAWNTAKWESLTGGVGRVDVANGKGRLYIGTAGRSLARVRALNAGQPLVLLEAGISAVVRMDSQVNGTNLMFSLRSNGGFTDIRKVPKNSYRISKSNTGNCELLRVVNGEDKWLAKIEWPNDLADWKIEFIVEGKAGEVPVIKFQAWPIGEERPQGYMLTFTDTDAPAELRQAGEVAINLWLASGGPHTVELADIRVNDVANAVNPVKIDPWKTVEPVKPAPEPIKPAPEPEPIKPVDPHPHPEPEPIKPAPEPVKPAPEPVKPVVLDTLGFEACPKSINEGGQGSFTVRGFYSDGTNKLVPAALTATEGTWVKDVLSIPANKTVGDNRTISVAATFEGKTATATVSVIDTTPKPAPEPVKPTPDPVKPKYPKYKEGQAVVKGHLLERYSCSLPGHG